MRKLYVLTFISMDGVMQSPGGPEEDASGGFKHGGWTVPYFDEAAGAIMAEQMSRPFDLLLGRKTYDIFASYWPLQDPEKEPIAGTFNQATKFVATRSQPKLDWVNSVSLGKDVPGRLRQLKSETGPELQVHGSGDLIQTLLKEDLVDELWLKVFPVTIGKGKRLFETGTIPAAFELTSSKISPKGVIVANYRRSGPLQTGSF